MNIPPKYEDVVAKLEAERELHKIATETLGQFADENQKFHTDLAECKRKHLRSCQLAIGKSQLAKELRVALKVANTHTKQVLERETALREELDSLKHWRGLALQFDNHRMRALWHLKTLVSDGAHYEAAAAFLTEPPIPATDLQQRLTVAEQRESLLKDLLTNAYIAINTMEPGFYLLEKIDAALKSAEEVDHGKA